MHTIIDVPLHALLPQALSLSLSLSLLIYSFNRVVDSWVAQFGVAGQPAVARAFEHAAIPNDPMVDGVSNAEGFVAFKASYDADASHATNRTTVKGTHSERGIAVNGHRGERAPQ